MTTLSNEEKISLIDTRLKNLAYSKYSLELGLLEENSVASPNEESINSLNEQIGILDIKAAALQSEKSALLV